jgi:hypothetical protein
MEHCISGDVVPFVCERGKQIITKQLTIGAKNYTAAQVRLQTQGAHALASSLHLVLSHVSHLYLTFISHLLFANESHVLVHTGESRAPRRRR